MPFEGSHLGAGGGDWRPRFTGPGRRTNPPQFWLGPNRNSIICVELGPIWRRFPHLLKHELNGDLQRVALGPARTFKDQTTANRKTVSVSKQVSRRGARPGVLRRELRQGSRPQLDKFEIQWSLSGAERLSRKIGVHLIPA